MTTTANDTDSKALELLSTGIPQGEVALALGVSEARISQLLADDSFSRKLADAKYRNLVKHNQTDNIYDSIELKLAQKLEQNLPLMMRPMEIARTLQTVNGLKRRGALNSESVVRSRPVITLTVPVAIVNHFKMNAAGQVISAASENGVQDLVTIQSGNMKGLVNEHVKQLTDERENQLYPSGRHVLPKRLRGDNHLTEADGKVYVKQQGREKTDIFGDCGFEQELSAELPPAQG